MKNLKALLTILFMLGFFANSITSLTLALVNDPWRPQDVTYFLYVWSALSFLFALVLGAQIRKP